MDALVNNKQTYQVLKHDPTPALQRKLNSKLLDLKKTDAIDIQHYNRLRCRVPQPRKLYGLPKLHKPNKPMRPIVSFCGYPTYQLSKYLTTVLKPSTNHNTNYSRLRTLLTQSRQYNYLRALLTCEPASHASHSASHASHSASHASHASHSASHASQAKN